MKIKSWQIISSVSPATEDELINILLANRGMTTDREKTRFFDPPPSLNIKVEDAGLDQVSIDQSIARIATAIRQKEKIIVYGDYDADGICASAIMWETLKSLGADCLPYIPDRISEGYGLNEDSIVALKKEDPNLKLIITVDHGIVGHKKINFAKTLGLDVIVTDHHQPSQLAPQALAIVHSTQLSGSGVAWFLARELLKSCLPKGSQLRIRELLELVAIGTIADLIPLSGVNRPLVKEGISFLRQTKRPGLLALFEQARLDPSTIGTFEIGYLISPRLNAAGRLEHAIQSLRMLCTKDPPSAATLAQKLTDTNRERQLLTEETVLHARGLITARQSKGEDFSSIIFIGHQSYQQGIIGLVAGKLVEEFYRPAIVLSLGDKYSKASARSIRGFNIIDTIREVSDLLVDVGGHPMAAGFTVETEKIDLLKKRLVDISSKKIGNPQRSTEVDLVLDFSLISYTLIDKLQKFEPFGQSNPEPTFATYDCEIVGFRTVGAAAQHLKLTLKGKNNRQSFEAIGFKMGDLYSRLHAGARIDILYCLSLNTWNGSQQIQFKLKDIKLPEDA